MNNIIDTKKNDTTLEGKFLIASPHLEDAYFERSIIYIYAHDENGAIGVIVNQQIGTLSSTDLLQNYHTTDKMQHKMMRKQFPVLFGGPINTEMVIALSTQEKEPISHNTHKVNLHIDMSKFIKEFIISKIQATKFIFVRGISAWDSTQLEQEIAANNWFVTNYSTELLFSQRIKYKWLHMIKGLGIVDFNYLVHYSGKC